MHAPLLVFAAIFACGIFFSGKINIPFLCLFIFCAFLILGGFIFISKNKIFILCLISIFFLFGTLYSRIAQAPAQCDLSRFIVKSPGVYTLKGIIVSCPQIDSGRMSFVLSSSQIQKGNFNYRCCGQVLVNLKGENKLAYGQELILQGKIFRPFSFNRNYLSRQRIYSVMSAKGYHLIPKIKGNPLKRIAFYWKTKVEKVIRGRLSGLPAAISEAMILGEKQHILPSVYQSLKRTGTVHIIVVSGFNVGIVTFLVVLLLKIFRLHRRLRILCAIPIILLYCFATGASTPVVRATVMAVVFLLSYFFKRDPQIYNSLGLAAFLILAINPNSLFDIGFQLSFISVLAIIFLYPKLKSYLRPERFNLPLRFCLEGFLVSLSAWLGTAGLIFYYFRIFSPVAVIANIVIVPIASLITVSGFCLVIFDRLIPSFAGLIALSIEFFVSLLLRINMFFCNFSSFF